MIIVPAVLAENKEKFLERINHPGLRSVARLWQVDVLDGSMFDRTSWHDSQELTEENLPEIELHLMVKNPLPEIEAWKTNVPALKRAIVHAELDRPIGAVLQRIRELKIEAGLALNPETPIELLRNHANEIDFLLIMGVHPGASGREFLGEPILEKIRDIKKLYPELKVGIDGGVNLKNAADLIAAGVHEFCMASALFETANPTHVYQQILALSPLPGAKSVLQ